MCVGLPMQVLECGDTWAVCDYNGERREINIMLVGVQSPGTWLMVFIDAAREVITEVDAKNTRNALGALEAVMNGNDANVDHFFADIIEARKEKDKK